MIYDTLDDTSRGMTGEYGQLNVYDKTLNKYVLLMPLETLPAVSGSVNTVENDVTTSRVVGKIKGKRTIDDKDVTFLWTRDNLERLNLFIGKQCDFLISYKDGTGWKFSGEITYKNDDGTSSDKLTGTFTIVASDVDEVATMNVLDLMAKTCVITNKNLPSVISIKANESYDIPVQMSNPSATVTATSDNESITATYSAGKVTITSTGSEATNGVVALKPVASGEASWINYILVEVTGNAE